MELTLRRATGRDLALVKQTLYLALAWDPDDPIPPFDDVVDHPRIAIYHRGWMRPGDAGVVAELAGRFVGMANLRRFTAGEPAQGFVDAETPELAIAVVPEMRGAGIGGRLLAALVDEAGGTGVARISLSVAAANPARRLYERHGFVPAPGRKPEVMVLTL